MNPESNISFKDLPDAYQGVIRLAQEQNRITVLPLQLLVGGWSGAYVYLVSVSFKDTKQVEHCVLKLDRKGKSPKSDEITRHTNVLNKSPERFSREHVPELLFDRIENEEVVVIFYRIAGESLLEYRPLSQFEQPQQLISIFEMTNTVILAKWNRDLTFFQAQHPRKVLQKWLGFRLDAGRPIEAFFKQNSSVNPDVGGLLINGDVLPNPLRYARESEIWGQVRPLDIAAGSIHGDLNVNNILVKFSEDQEAIRGYFLIDFALFKTGMPLLYDQRYLEMSYLMQILAQVSLSKMVDFLKSMVVGDVFDLNRVSVGFSGVGAVISAARKAFAAWVDEHHPSLHDDLWGQYWLAGAAAGLSYTHKAGLPDEQRLAGLIYAAANLKRFNLTFNLPQPRDVAFLFDGNQTASGAGFDPGSVQPKHNLPQQPTRFIGRSMHVSAIKGLLEKDDVRLVTLIGPGGTGKTRLSIQVAGEVLDQYPDGVVFVPLADDTDADQFVSRVAQQLHVRQGGRPLLESLKDYLREKRVLLILDNFEQLVTAAPIVVDLMASAPQVKMIVSSRIALNIQGEWLYPVPPLNLPSLVGGTADEDLLETEAVQLFIERAQAVKPGFSATKADAAVIAEICRQLDGLPLAIELAAARIRILTPQAILSRLDNSLKLLAGGARDLPARQQTLRNTLKWSFDLLDEEEQTLFARLSVFAGGFSLEAVEAVCDPEDKLDVLDGLTSLVDNSLIRQEVTNTGEVRFGMLETIRTYALEQLKEKSTLDKYRERHAHYFGEIVVSRIGFELFSEHALAWLDWLEIELSNLRAALQWCLDTPGGLELGIQVVFALTWFWYRRGYFLEGMTWAERILASPQLQEPSPIRALAQQNFGILAVWKGEQQKGLVQLEESLNLLFQTEEAQYIGPGLISKAVALINMGRDADAQPLLKQAQGLFKEMGFDYFTVIALVHLGNVELGLGAPQQARAALEEGQTIAQQLNEPWILSFVLNNLGEVARVEGQYDQARSYYEACQSLLNNTGDRGDQARFVHSLGYIAQHEGDHELAESLFRESLRLLRQLGNRRGIAECLAGLAGLKARVGHPRWGATLLAAAESLLLSTGGAWWPADRVEVERNRDFIHSALSQEVFKSAWKLGEAMTIEQAIDFSGNDPA